MTPGAVRELRIQEDLEEIAELEAHRDHGSLEIEEPKEEAEYSKKKDKKKKYTSRGDLRKSIEEDEPLKRHWKHAKPLESMEHEDF